MNSKKRFNTRLGRNPRNRLILGLVLFGLVALGTSSMFAAMQRQLIYIPLKGRVPRPQEGLLRDRITEVSCKVHDGIKLHGWLATPHTHSSQICNQLVIVFPGNAGNRANRIPILEQVVGLGRSALIFDYRGYAENHGSPSEEAFAKDARCICDFALHELGFSAHQIILCGQSLGGGVASRLAWELCHDNAPPGGLILRATFTSLVDAGRHNYPWLPVGWVLVDRYPSVERIGQVSCPILSIHGRRDLIVPFRQGRSLFEAAPETSHNGITKRFLDLPYAGHNDIMYVATDQVRDELQGFLDEIHAVSPLELEK